MTLINKVNMSNNKSGTKIARTICGPYDSQFLKKFRGRQTQSMSVDRLKLNKMINRKVHQQKKSSALTQNMLPKLKQLQKIAKTERKKPFKLNKYVDGISDLELYITNKLMNKQSTKQIINQISKNLQQQDLDRNSIVNQNYMTMTFSGQEKKFHQIDLNKMDQNRQRLMRTEYAGGMTQKWVSDKDFADTFQSFLDKGPPEEKKSKAPQQFTQVSKKRLTENEIAQQLNNDKAQITRIAKKMIAQQNETEEQQFQENVLLKSSLTGEQSKRGENSIDWILKECNDYERKFVIRGGKSKAISNKI